MKRSAFKTEIESSSTCRVLPKFGACHATRHCKGWKSRSQPLTGAHICMTTPQAAKPMFEFSISQFAYAKRTWWCLSGLLQQIDSPSLRVRLNIHVSDPFRDLNHKLIDCFRDRLDLVVIEWRHRHFFSRGRTRCNDLKQASGEWLIFLDADSIFEPTFLRELARRPLDPTKLTGIPRTTMTDFEAGYGLVDAEAYGHAPIDHVAQKCATVPCLSRGRHGGAGYFQLVHPETVNRAGHVYSPRRRDTRYDDPSGYRTPSDFWLRRQIGLRVIRDLPHLYHLQHWRRLNPNFPDRYQKICH